MKKKILYAITVEDVMTVLDENDENKVIFSEQDLRFYHR